MIIGGSAYYELLCDNYRPRGWKWVKMSKEEAKAYDNDPDINAIFSPDMEYSSNDNYSDDIDKLECDKDGHANFPF